MKLLFQLSLLLTFFYAGLTASQSDNTANYFSRPYWSKFSLSLQKMLHDDDKLTELIKANQEQQQLLIGTIGFILNKKDKINLKDMQFISDTTTNSTRAQLKIMVRELELARSSHDKDAQLVIRQEMTNETNRLTTDLSIYKRLKK